MGTSARIWIVGTSQDCDIWVHGPQVAERHCRLTERPDGFLLEDLRSAGGTFLNGKPLANPCVVRHGDRITLGNEVPFPWSELPHAVRVGRAPDNDFVIARDMVSAYHARVERIGDLIYLVDLGSTNGTAINSPLNRISRSVLTSGDTVFLGTHPLAAADLLAVFSHDQSKAAESTERRGWFAFGRAHREWVLGVLLSLIVVALATLASRYW